MNRIVAIIVLGLGVVSAGSASAWDRAAIQLRVSAGVSAQASPYYYDTPSRLAGTPRVLGVGASIRLQPMLSATIDVDHTLLGRGGLGALPPEMTASIDPSMMTTALLGLELKPAVANVLSPYLTAGIGAGRMTFGVVQIMTMNGADYIGNSVDPEVHSAGPAFALGAGVRTSPLWGGPRLRFGLRTVRMLAHDHWMGIIPVSASVEY